MTALCKATPSRDRGNCPTILNENFVFGAAPVKVSFTASVIKSGSSTALFERGRTLWPLVFSLLILVTATACTLPVNQDASALPKAESVAIVSKGPTDDLKARFGVSPAYSSKGKGAGVGAGAGAVAGAGASLACGPFALLCATLTVPAGALVGAVGGTLAGTAVDAQKKPPEEQLLVLDQLFVDIASQRTIHEEIEASLKGLIPASRQQSFDDADMVLQINLYDVQFTQTSEGHYALTLKSLLQAQWNRDMRHIRNGKRVYRYSSRSLPLEDWISDDGVTLNLAFDACVAALAEEMARDVQFTPVKKTGTTSSDRF